jgi:hypothetical protein
VVKAAGDALLHAVVWSGVVEVGLVYGFTVQLASANETIAVRKTGPGMNPRRLVAFLRSLVYTGIQGASRFSAQHVYDAGKCVRFRVPADTVYWGVLVWMKAKRKNDS